MKSLLLLVITVLTGCAGFLTRDESYFQQEKEDQQIASAKSFLDQGKFQEAKDSYLKFQVTFPNSRYFQSARLGEAESLHGLGEYQYASELYRSIHLATRQYQPEIAALALYQLAFTYEALGEDSRTAAALLDAKKLSQYLPVQVAVAEIPARLASIYGRQGQDKEAISFLNEADRGIDKVSSQLDGKTKTFWLGKTYFQMGSVSTNQLSVSNYEPFVNGQKLVQVYLIKALRLNDTNWSSRAQTKLQETYQQLYFQFASLESDRQTAKNLGGNLFDLIAQAELYKPGHDQKMNIYEEAFFNYVAEIRQKLEQRLYGHSPFMELTEESKKLNSINRVVLPQDQNSSISIPVLDADGN